MSNHILDVGERMTLRFGVLTKWVMAYAGMPTPTTFSVAVMWVAGVTSAAYNLFFPVGQQEIVVCGKRFRVERAGPERIEIRAVN